MPLKRLAVGIAAAFLFSTLGLATSAQAIKRFSVVGGGSQSHIGNGLAIPIQQAAINSVTTGTMFPMTLRAPINGVPIVTGTVVNPLMTGTTMTGPGLMTMTVTRMAYQRRLNIPAGVIRKTASKRTVGVKFSNPTVFAVATNLNFSWPAAPAVLSTGAAPPAVITGFGGSLTYNSAFASRFGGPAAFAISSGDPVAGDLYPVSPTTVFIKVNATTPPCTFPAMAGCVNGVILAYPGPLGGVGQSGIVSTPGGAVPATSMNPNALNVVGAKMGLTPLGTHLAAPVLIAVNTMIPTNMAMSQGGGWTTGMLTVANPAAVPMTETWVISGMDSRTALGGGTIQLVAGAVSARPASGANANRGWVRLVLSPTFPVPSMSMPGIAALVGLMVVAFGYTMRRKLFA